MQTAVFGGQPGVRVTLQANKRESDLILTHGVKVTRSEFQIVFSASSWSTFVH